MFEFSRELKRFFQADAPRDGLTGGDASLLELLELKMLASEARAADIAAGRISATDRPMRRLEAAIVWREIARRTGDAVALRKSASAAELAASGFKAEHRMQGWARARCEQACAALLGAELFGDDGLNAAADIAFADAAAVGGHGGGHGLAAQIAALGRAQIAARTAIATSDRVQTLAIAARFDAPSQALEVLGRRRAIGRLLAAQGRADRARFLTACGLRLKDPMLLRMALDGLAQTLNRLDAAYEPLTWARATTLRAIAKTALADLDGEIGQIAEAMNDMVGVLEHVSRDHSPLDWARTQVALAGALQMLGEAGNGQDCAFDQAEACLDRALTVFNAQPALSERASAAYGRAVSLARRAELSGDLGALAKAEAVLRAELAAANPSLDPVGWAVRQLNFARLYEARAGLAGPNAKDRSAAALALSAALDVFGEHGLRALADVAARGLERMRVVQA
jgi:hypothetical protein